MFPSHMEGKSNKIFSMSEGEKEGREEEEERLTFLLVTNITSPVVEISKPTSPKSKKIRNLDLNLLPKLR